MKKYLPYNPDNPVLIQGETHEVLDGQIWLDHVPLKDSLKIEGFVQFDELNALTQNGFYIDYKAADRYLTATGIVYFLPAHEGRVLSCSYLAVGTLVTASDLNEINERLTNLENAKIEDND